MNYVLIKHKDGVSTTIMYGLSLEEAVEWLDQFNSVREFMKYINEPIDYTVSISVDYEE